MPWPIPVLQRVRCLQFKTVEQMERVLPANFMVMVRGSRRRHQVRNARGGIRSVVIMEFWTTNPLMVVVGSDQYIRRRDLDQAMKRSHEKPPAR